jgi:tRNA pseudouridine55 synthase
MFAVVNVFKPAGLTSHDVVARLRRVYGLKKVGHLGTLDPLAEGVLPVCLGQATRLIEYFPSDKRYRAEVTFGITTTTLDQAGERLSDTPCPELTPQAVQDALGAFIGTIQQKVPMHSAVHVGGKKLYKYAHQGIEVETPVKTVAIESIELLSFSPGPYPVATLDIACGSGTYIRALARDLGEALGCGAYLSGLVRTGHGHFTDQDAVPLAELMESDAPQVYLRDPVPYLGWSVLELPEGDTADRLMNGMKIQWSEVASQMSGRLRGNELSFATVDGRPLAVVQKVGLMLKPLKVFIQPETAAQTLPG